MLRIFLANMALDMEEMCLLLLGAEFEVMKFKSSSKLFSFYVLSSSLTSWFLSYNLLIYFFNDISELLVLFEGVLLLFSFLFLLPRIFFIIAFSNFW